MSFFSDFTKNIGGIAKDAALSGLAKGIRESQLNSLFGGYSTGEGNNFSLDLNPTNGGNDFSLFGLGSPSQQTYHDYDYLNSQNKHPLDNVDKTNLENSDYKKKYSDNTFNDNNDEYQFNIPRWGYNDFINERNIFIKHLSNGFDEPGWFYFKIFFDFSSDHGLFGGIMNSINSSNHVSVNSATDYLTQCKDLFKYEKLEERIVCLQRFTRLLSYININAPWFFKSVKNLSNVSNPKIDVINSDEQYIELELDQDAVDMRISTLLSLYKYVCYDDINNKEILPDNLRKFDMCIFMFASPIKFIHNIQSNDDQTKSLYNNTNSTSNPSSIMSFKLYKFLNCEIDPTTLGGYVNSDIKNDQPFALGQNTIKIKYDRVYEYSMNEFFGFMFGSDGIYLDNPNISVKDIKDLTILSEKQIHNNISNILKGNSRFALGNIYGQDRQIYERNMSDTAKSKNFTEYASTKYGLMNNNKNFILNTGYNMLYKLLGTGYNANAEVLKVGKKVIGDGTALNGHGDYRVGSAVWRAKMKRLLTGSKSLSDRENRLIAVGTAKHTNWMMNLQNMAVNAVKSII